MEDKRNGIMVITVFTTTWKHSTTEANMASANFLFIYYFFSEITNLPKGPFIKKRQILLLPNMCFTIAYLEMTTKQVELECDDYSAFCMFINPLNIPYCAHHLLFHQNGLKLFLLFSQCCLLFLVICLKFLYLTCSVRNELLICFFSIWHYDFDFYIR